MAAAYDALVSLMNTIQPIKNHPLISTFFFKEQIESIGQNVDFLVDFIEKYSSHEGINDLEKRIASAANEAEVVIESHIMDQIRADERSGSIFLADLQKIIEEMDCFKEETINVIEERRSIKDEQMPATCSTPAAATSWRAHQTKMVGVDEKLRQLMDVLTREESSCQIISVVGMGGIGKSTLVRNTYAKFSTMDHFDVHAWASVTQKYSATGILIDLLVCLKQETASETVQELGEKLHKVLYRRRYLIVLDDVWSVEVWDEIKFFFPDNNNKSRIILTSRVTNVANNLCDSSNCFRMNLLDEDKSWVLFCETVFGCEDCPPELVKVGKEISKQCRGLPLSIVVIGGLLRRSNKTVEYWNNVAKNVNSVLNNSDEGEGCYKILSLSYSQLDVHLKPCFVCMGIFPEGREIRVSYLIKVWIANGLIKPNHSQTLEEIAEGYLHELVDRNLVVVGKMQFMNQLINWRSCLVHDLVRAVCLRKSEEDQFFCLRRARGIERKHRIICDDFMPSDKKSLRDLNMAERQEAIFMNLNLRFLTEPSSGTIPSSVSLIWNLQTFMDNSFFMYPPHEFPKLRPLWHLRFWMIKQGTTCVWHVVAPLEIWNLQQLRHVDFYNIYIPDPPQNVRHVVLENLQTLKTVGNLTLSEDVCKRIPNVNKLYLEYDSDRLGFDHRWCDHLHNLGSLHKLRSLKLDLNFNSSSFRAGWLATSLKKLKLIACCIDWNDLSIIGSLPHLEVLKLDNSMEGENWSPTEGEFLSLKVLSIGHCGLRCWNADSSHFPVLEKLFLVWLWNLEEIPLDIGEIPTLQLIHLYKCSNSVEISAEDIKKQQENQGNDSLRIQIQTDPSRREQL